MGDHDESGRAIKNARADQADKAASDAKPDEARMSEIAKRLLATPPKRKDRRVKNPLP